MRFPIAESGFDPAQVTDLYSNTVLAHIFEAPLEYEYLAQPARMRPNTAAALPECRRDHRRFVFTIKPGIYFADDPAFGGKRRELTAHDYVYSFKRHYDPRWKSGKLYLLETDAHRRPERTAAGSDRRTSKPFDYDREVEGLRALDRYRFEVKLRRARARASISRSPTRRCAGAVAREVVEFYGDRISEHPVGTGPFRLAEWRRSSRMVLERNPNYREVLLRRTPAGRRHAARGDRRAAQGQAHADGRPGRDRRHRGAAAALAVVPERRAGRGRAHARPTSRNIAVPNGQLAPHLAKRGIQMVRYQRNDVSVSYFAMENPVVGGYTPDKVALRRAIALAVDVEREIRLARYGQAIPAQSHVGAAGLGLRPGVQERDERVRPRQGAKALLDLYGYVDRDGDGWREQPDGQPLTLEYATSARPDAAASSYELWKKQHGGDRHPHRVPLIGQVARAT